MDTLETWPSELIVAQALNLPLLSIIDFCQTSRRFNQVICTNEGFWYQKFVTDYEFQPTGYRGSWKQLYEEYSSIWGIPGAIREPTMSTLTTVAIGSGFLEPTLFDDDLVRFFADVKLGPVIEGKFTTTGTKSVPDTKSLRPVNRPLNSILFFTKPTILGQKNPLYGIITPASLTVLFALHAYYSGMHYPGQETQLNASPEMRHYLRPIMERSISQDVDRLIQRGVPQDEAENIGQFFMQGLDEPLQLDEILQQQLIQYGASSFFNPFKFSFAQFSKLIAAAKTETLSAEELEALTPEVTRIYGPLFPDYEVVTPQMIIQYQQDMITLARAYKNQQQTQLQRQQKALRRVQL